MVEFGKSIDRIAQEYVSWENRINMGTRKKKQNEKILEKHKTNLEQCCNKYCVWAVSNWNIQLL